MHAYFTPHQLQKKSGWAVSYTMCLLCFSSCSFFYQLHHRHALALFLYLPHQSVSFSPSNSAITLTTLSVFSCPLRRWEIWTAPKSFTSVWPHPQLPHLPPSSFALPLLLLLPSSSASFDSSNCSMLIHIHTHSITQQGTTFPSIRNQIYSSIFHLYCYYSLVTSWQNSKLSCCQFCVKISGSLAWGCWQFSTRFLMFLFLVKPQWYTSYTCQQGQDV